jgi:hypothetical protein
VAFCVDVTFRKQATEILNEIPLRLAARGFSSLFAQKNFDFAQDDIQWVCMCLFYFIRNQGLGGP